MEFRVIITIASNVYILFYLKISLDEAITRKI